MVVAALVLLLAVIAGGPRASQNNRAPVMPENPDLFLGDPGSGDQLPVGTSKGFYYESHDGGRLMRLRADQLVPLPDGVGDLTHPIAQIQLAPGREVTITADEGTLVMPDNHPREGVMRGHVVVTMYETPDGSPVDFASDRHVVTRIYFDDPVQFDLELHQIDSDGAIFLTGPQIEFRGRGLSLNYNQLRRRIERLVIEHGQTLRNIPEPKSRQQKQVVPGTASTQLTQAGDDAPKAPKPGGEEDHPTADASAVDPDDADESQPTQYYLARFEQLRQIDIGREQYIVEGDELEVVFSAKTTEALDEPGPGIGEDQPGGQGVSRGGGDGDTQVGGVLPGDGHARLAVGNPLHEALLQVVAMSLGQVSPEDSRSLATFTQDDIVISFDGRLTVEPLDSQPVALAGPDDAMVTIVGSPAKVHTDGGETILARRIAFLRNEARLLAEGSDIFPVTVAAPDMGVLTGRELSISQRLGTGYVLGPGVLTGRVRDDGSAINVARPDSNDRTQADEAQDAEPKRITVAWAERLNLTFFLKDSAGRDIPEDAAPAQGSKIKGVKTADFFGHVEVDYTELDMTSDRLTLELAPEDDRALLADAQSSQTQAGDTPDPMAVKALTAQGNVHVLVKDQDVELVADRLIADPATDQLQLFAGATPGSTPASSPAQVIRPDATLAGDHLVMDQRNRTVHVIGAGWFDFLADPDQPDKTVRVNWTDSMNYDDAAGAARFVGKVETFSVDGTDTTKLSGEDLSLSFAVVDPGDEPDDPQADRFAGRTLQTAVMQGGVQFKARSYATEKRQTMLTQMFLMGPEMTFHAPGPDDPKDAAQWVMVPGPGRMLITDNRPAKEKSKREAKSKQGKGIDISGRGMTAFEWSDMLTLDLTRGEMLMEGQVAMVHRGEAGDKVQLDALQLAVELKPAPPGSGGWLSDDAPKPEIEKIWADGGIRIIHDKYTVRSDHLLYQEDKREIILWSDDRHVATVEVQGEPNLTKSRAFKWHRDTGRIEALRFRTGMIPLRRSERRSD